MGFKTKAVATITIKIDNIGEWGGETTTEQVYKQAKEAAISRIRHALNGKATVLDVVVSQVIVVGK